jgi:nitrate/nitrite-specific signal transduction histidine kinase
MSDDDAFRVLRTASMHSNQRLGLVGQHIIASARFAEGVNRAGQLRMLSQRLLTLYLLELAQPALGQGSARLDAALRIDTNLAWLGKSFSDRALSSSVQQVAAPAQSPA